MEVGIRGPDRNKGGGGANRNRNTLTDFYTIYRDHGGGGDSGARQKQGGGGGQIETETH